MSARKVYLASRFSNAASLRRVRDDLGFDAEWSLVPACAVGASHTRPRLFFVAYPKGADAQGEVSRIQVARDGWPEPRGSGRAESRPGRWLPEPALDRMADGVPRRVVRGPLHALGNAVAPPVGEAVGMFLLAIHAALNRGASRNGEPK